MILTPTIDDPTSSLRQETNIFEIFFRSLSKSEEQITQASQVTGTSSVFFERSELNIPLEPIASLEQTSDQITHLLRVVDRLKLLKIRLDPIVSLEQTSDQITETYTIVDRQDELDTWLYLAATFEQQYSIELSIYLRFYSIKQVQSIYVQDLTKVYNTFVFLNQERYDDELMDRLLDREGEILDRYQDILFDFHYLPILSDLSEQLIPENAIKIFSR